MVADVNISGLNAEYTGSDTVGPALGTFDLVFTYNPLVLQNLAINFGDPVLGDQLALTTPGFTCVGVDCGAASNLPVEIAEVSFDPDTALIAKQAPAFTLATFSFTAIAPGTSALTLTSVVLGDQDGNALTPDQILNSTVVVGTQSSTPEPGSGVLILAGLGLALLGSSRRFLRART